MPPKLGSTAAYSCLKLGTARDAVESPVSVKGVPLAHAIIWLKGTNRTTRATSKIAAILFNVEIVGLAVADFSSR